MENESKLLNLFIFSTYNFNIKIYVFIKNVITFYLLLRTNDFASMSNVILIFYQ